jgi:hypothetical protein
VRRRPEESVRGHQTIERLVRPLEVVVLDVQAQPPLAVCEISEDRARQEFFPQRLPEPLDFSQGLRMLRPALAVRDAVAPQLLLERALPAPHRVLPPVVGQRFPRHPIICDPSRQRLHHQLTALVVRQRIRHQVPRVVVHEARQVQPLVPSQQKREDVRLPKLIRLRALETTRSVLARWRRRPCLRDKPLLVQDAPHLALGYAKRFEAP